MDQKEQVNKSTPTLNLVLLFQLTTQALVFAASSKIKEGRRGWAHLGRRVDSREHCNSVRNSVNLFVMKIRMRPGESLKSGGLSKEQKQYCGLNARDPDFSPSSDTAFLCDHEPKKKTKNLSGSSDLASLHTSFPSFAPCPTSTPGEISLFAQHVAHIVSSGWVSALEINKTSA